MTQPIILPYKGEYVPSGVSPVISPKAFIAPGAAVQNMNVMHGYPETLALEQGALFP